jgi:uncharacterized protein (DUF1697 family)
MKTYIAILRGINVSGQKKIKMADLRSHLENIGSQNVQTYIQSGNIVFQDQGADNRQLELKIRKMIEEEYEFDVPVMVLDPATLVKIIANNPFDNREFEDTGKLYVTFLSEVPQEENVKKLQAIDAPGEHMVIAGKHIYFYYAIGYGKSKINNNFIESKLKVIATTRNWKTVNTLSEMANEP